MERCDLLPFSKGEGEGFEIDVILRLFDKSHDPVHVTGRIDLAGRSTIHSVIIRLDRMIYHPHCRHPA